jgi:glycosyltransferase involved in cell wall biosynthesis
MVQLARQLRSLAAAAWTALTRKATIVVVMTRGWFDELPLAFAAMLGARVIAIAHDPVPKTPLSRFALFSRRTLWRRATTLVAHSEKLAAQAAAAAGRPVKVVSHLPFTEYMTWTRSVAPDAKSPTRKRFLVLGRMSADKGLARLPAILGLVPEEKRNRIAIAFAGKGNCDDIIARLPRQVEVSRLPVDRFLSDPEIAQELAQSDVLLAPYALNTTASGSVILALCRGLSVVAYDAGALADVVAADGLVRHGDEAGFAARIGAVLDAPCGGPTQSLDAWRQASLEAWLAAI